MPTEMLHGVVYIPGNRSAIKPRISPSPTHLTSRLQEPRTTFSKKVQLESRSVSAARAKFRDTLNPRRGTSLAGVGPAIAVPKI